VDSPTDEIAPFDSSPRYREQRGRADIQMSREPTAIEGDEGRSRLSQWPSSVFSPDAHHDDVPIGPPAKQTATAVAEGPDPTEGIGSD